MSGRLLAAAALSCLAACGGSSSSHLDLAAASCPADITSVADGDPCAGIDQQCNQCTSCAGCVELFCNNGQWIHVLEHDTCDGGDDQGS